MISKLNHVIGVTGKKGSGKTTAAKYLAHQGYVRVNFKDALLKEIKEKFPKTLSALVRLIEREQYNGIAPLTVDRLLEEKTDEIARFFLQEYGTDVRRVDNEDYWVVKWLKNAKHHSLLVVDDVRFINEADAVRGLNGIIVRIVREGQVSNDTHTSETQMDMLEPDYTITVPDGRLDLMYAELDKITKSPI